MWLVELVVALGIFASFAYWRLTPQIWFLLGTILLVVYGLFSGISYFLLVPMALVFVGAVVFAFAAPIRAKFVSRPVFAAMKKSMPPMSKTERIALEAGDVWFDGELFQGDPNFRKLRETPLTKLTKEERNFLDNQTATLCSMLNEWEITRAGDLPKEAWDYIKKEHFLGMVIDKKYGGLGFSPSAHSAVITKIASRSPSTAVSVMVPNSLGPAELLQMYGTNAQKQQYLPRLAVGDDIPCFALTGVESGSDAASMFDTGVVCKGEYQGKEVMGIRLNFNKRYITLAPIATLVGVAFKLSDPDNLLGKGGDIGITLALIPSKTPGLKVGERHSPLGMAFLNGPVVGKDVFIPVDAVIGGEGGLGEGWRMLMESLSIGRSLSLPALGNAISKISLASCSYYGYLRQQFGMPIGKFEGVQEQLGAIAGYTYMLEATRQLTASAVSQGVRPSLVSAIAKYHLTELCRKSMNMAMDIHGGRGIQTGPRNYLADHYVSLPICITVEGANILTRNLIIFGQGAVRCHPYTQRELQLLLEEENDRTLNEFDGLLFRHVGYTLCNAVRSFFYGLTGGRLIASAAKTQVRPYYRQLTRMSTALAFVGDVAMMMLGGNLKRKEQLSARLGDVLSHLYLASAVLRFYHERDHEASEQASVDWAVTYSLEQIQIAFDGFFRNFPNRFVGRLLRTMVFPFGASYRAPLDTSTRKLADQALSQEGAFKLLTQLVYRGGADDPLLGSLEDAALSWRATEPLRDKIKEAQREGQLPQKIPFVEIIAAALKQSLLTDEEAEQLRAAEAKRQQAIEVDDFAFDELLRAATPDFLQRAAS
jgi:acyl-CoA dehydrogenase